MGTAERAPVADELDSLAESWALSLEAENKSDRTVTIYTESVRASPPSSMSTPRPWTAAA